MAASKFHCAATQAAAFCVALGAILAAPSAAAPAEPNPRVAAVLDLDQLPAAPLLQARLQARQEFVWVERDSIDQILREHKLQAMFGPEGLGDRVRIGKQLKADILILLRKSAAPRHRAPPAVSPSTIDVVVAETGQGLRLASHSIPLTSDPVADAKALDGLIVEAMRRRFDSKDLLVAVSPLLSGDLVYKFDYQKAAFAKVIEQTLRDQRGVWLVELVEAQAIARELALHPGTGGIQRPLPYLISGDYRDTGVGADRRVKLTLKLMRDRAKLGERETELPPDEVPGFLQSATLELLAATGHPPGPPTDGKVEARQLAERAREFMKVGSWDEAMPLLEASLLLDPTDPEVRRDAIIVSDPLAKRFIYNRDDSAVIRASFASYRRGLEHIDYFARHVVDFQPYRPQSGKTFLDEHFFHWDTAGMGYPADMRNEYLVMLGFSRVLLLDIVDFRARHNIGEEKIFMRPAIRTFPRNIRFAVLAQTILELQNLPGSRARTCELAIGSHMSEVLYNDPTADKEFLERLETARSSGVRAAVLEIKQAYDQARKRAGTNVAGAVIKVPLPPIRAPKSAIVAPQQASVAPPGGVQDLRFEPLQLEIEGSGGQHLSRLDGCISAGNFEAMWSAHSFYIMKQPGKLRLLLDMPDLNERVGTYSSMYPNTHVVYDGRYLWAAVKNTFDPAHNPPRLMVMDPVAEKSWEFTPDDGLPLARPGELSKDENQQHLAIAALTPGKTCVTGSFGRAWIAIASFDPERGKSVDVIQECRDAVNTTLPNQWTSPTVAFDAQYMFTLTDPQSQEQRVVVGRSARDERFYCHPLLVDPVAKSVDVLPATIPLIQHPEFFSMHEGALHFVTRERPYELTRVGFPDFTLTTMTPDVPRGWVFIVGDEVHLVNRKWWWGKLGEKLRLVADRFPWKYMPAFEMNPRRQPDKKYDWAGTELVTISQSKRYGLVAAMQDGYRNGSLFQVSMPPEKVLQAATPKAAEGQPEPAPDP